MTFPMLLSSNRKRFFLSLAIGILFTFVCVIVPRVSGELINEVMSGGNVTALVIQLVIFSIIQLLMSIADQLVKTRFFMRQKQLMRNSAFHSFSKSQAASREERSEFTSFVNNHIPDIAEQYFQGVIDIVNCVSVIAFSAIALFTIHWLIAAIIIAISVLMVLIPKSMQKRGSDARVRYTVALDRYNTTLHSFLGGLPLLRAYNYRKRANDILSRTNENVAFAEQSMANRQHVVYGMAGFLQITQTVLVVLSGVLLITNNVLSAGDLIAAVQLAAIIGAPMEVLSYLLHSRNSVKPLLDEYIKLISKKELRCNAVERHDAEICDAEICVENLSYSIDDLKILDNVSIRFKYGGKYLLTGASGSGKSTFINLLGCLGREDYSGTIKLCGVDICGFDSANYSQLVCTIPQEPYLFCATLEENIKLGRDVDEYEYSEVIKKLNLTYIFERYGSLDMDEMTAENLSGGEKQRICLARAMVGNPRVYLLDEVTSALDEATSLIVESLLLDIDATIIHVCHKPNADLLARYDEILICENHRIQAHPHRMG